MLGFQALGSIALGQAGPAFYSASVSENSNLVDACKIGYDNFVFVVETLDGISPFFPVQITTESFFGFAHLGILALGQADYVQYSPLENPAANIDTYSCVAQLHVAWVDGDQVAQPVTNIWGFEALGYMALGQADDIHYIKQVELIDFDIGFRGQFATVSEEIQPLSNPSSMWDFQSLGVLALGQAGNAQITPGFFDTEAAFRIGGPPNLDKLWWNNVRFKQNDYPIYKNTRSDIPIPRQINWPPPPKFFYIATSESSPIDDGYQQFTGQSPGYIFGFQALGIVALGELVREIPRPGPQYLLGETSDSAPLYDSKPGPSFGFQVLGGIALGEMINQVSTISAT